MKIIVPSLGRAGNSKSLQWLRDTKREKVLAVHEDEAKAYAMAYPWATIMVLPDTVRRHAGRLRQHIMETVGKPFFFVDDDIALRLVRFQSVEQMFDQLEVHMKHSVMAGIGKQIFNMADIANSTIINGDTRAIRNRFCSTVYGIDPRYFKECPLQELVVYEDVALILHGILAGGNIVSYSATHNNKSPAEGGCNSWRTPDIIKKSMVALADLYPDYVKIIDTYHSAHSQDLGVGIRVAWSKAAKAAERSRR